MAELKIPLIGRVPRTMNRQGNKRTTKEGSTDLKVQNIALLKNKSWPQINTATGQRQAVNEPLLDCERKFPFLDGAGDPRDGDYEDPELHVAEAWRSMKILPARPIKESEYADTRYFKTMVDPPVSLEAKRTINMEGPTWNSWMRLEEVDKPISKDIRSHRGKASHIPSLGLRSPPTEIQWDTMASSICESVDVVHSLCQVPWWKYSHHGGFKAIDAMVEHGIGKRHHFSYFHHRPNRGNKPTKGNKTPLPPPRPPISLPKKYQPLPKEPEGSRPSSPQRHTFPETQTGARQISLKNLGEVLGTEKVPHHPLKPEASHLSKNQSAPEIPLAIASPSFLTGIHSMRNRDHKESSQFHPPQRCQSPASYSPRKNSLYYKNMSWRKPSPARSDEKDVHHNEWYIGEYSRQAVEEALMKESKDGTFLVRDCSAKSQAEPYVLVVFYGNRVYNVKIRFLERNQQFALGTGLRGDEKFDSVEDIIEHYKYFPIVLIDGKDKTGIHKKQCYLTQPLPVSRHFSTL